MYWPPQGQCYTFYIHPLTANNPYICVGWRTDGRMQCHSGEDINKSRESFIEQCQRFLDALASLVMMINNDWQTEWLGHWKLRVLFYLRSHANVTQNGMSLKMEFHSKWKSTQNIMSLKMEYHLECNLTQKGQSLKIECHSKRNLILNKFDYKWNVTKN